MSFRVLGAEGADAECWRELIARLPPRLRDLHYFPEYGRIYRDTYGYEPLLAAWERDGQLIVHAFVRRLLNTLPFLAQSGAGDRYTDIATPYGFGGPLVSNPERSDVSTALRAFDSAYRAWCSAEQIAAEFVCLHPLLDNQIPIAASGVVPLRAEKAVVVIDLTPAEDVLWAAISRGTRSSIQRARREGVTVEQVTADERSLGAFHGLYLATMQRRGAAARWFFPETYFSDCVRHLGPDGSALFYARCDGEVAAAYLLLNDACSAYYHFGASDARWFERRPNNVLMYDTLLWAKRRGLARYHLGGGVTQSGNDSLLRFKSSFGGAKAMLYTYGRVLNQDVYRRLCALKLEHERQTAAPVAHPDYFPLYRR